MSNVTPVPLLDLTSSPSKNYNLKPLTTKVNFMDISLGDVLEHYTNPFSVLEHL